MKKKILPLVASVLVICLAVGALELYKRYKESQQNHFPIEDCHGVDLSHYNDIDSKHKAFQVLDNVQFIIAKATEGKLIVDEKFKKHRKYARKHDKKFGAYHFLTMRTPVKDQFENYKRVVGKDIDILPIVDIEKNNGVDWSKKQAREYAQEWIKLCKEYYGVEPIIYCTERYRNKFFPDFSNPFWIANWNGTPSRAHVIHQYTDNRNVLDYNRLNVPLTQILLNPPK